MPIRTSAELVAGIIEVDTDIDLDPFIEGASTLVDTVCAVAGDGAFYTAPELELIERWLSAHFYTVRDPRSSAESAGVSSTYQSAVKVGFSTSHYGQIAMRLDRAGGLAALDALSSSSGEVAGAGKATIFWLGKDKRSVLGEENLG